jgi:nucleoside phosphorylase
LKNIEKIGNVLLVVVTSTECDAVFDEALKVDTSFKLSKNKRKPGKVSELPSIDSKKVVLFRAAEGSLGPNSFPVRAAELVNKYELRAVFLVGIAFAVADVQPVASVAIGSSIFMYDRRTVCENPDIVVEYARSPARQPFVKAPENLSKMFNRFRASKGVSVELGAVLSGGAVVESRQFRDKLVQDANAFIGTTDPDIRVVAGEMEAAGLLALGSVEPEVGWLVMKGIADHATGQSRTGTDYEANRTQAAANAAQVVFDFLCYDEDV